jgi:hypothetical protein
MNRHAMAAPSRLFKMDRLQISPTLRWIDEADLRVELIHLCENIREITKIS